MVLVFKMCICVDILNSSVYHLYFFIWNCVNLCLVEFHVYVSGFDSLFIWIFHFLVWNCLYMRGFDNDYFLLYAYCVFAYLNLYFICLFYWNCIYTWMIAWMFIHEYLYVIWNFNHVFVALNYEFDHVCIM